ncbi:glycoside hydrolase family 16 protein [Piloderma croceum F 1598]|uniref:Glycoside hydrolase family 16 protein n=1 Tax=Piloderma croceum (strain F 1598) TaxID=765440 RepID=A0A0C3G2U9_PILCF|nr:glycoside hydrolase family 16 protein [Piloderma croceum F 1598]
MCCGPKFLFCLLALVSSAALHTAALPSFSDDTFGLRSRLSSLIPRRWETRWSNVGKRQASSTFETDANGSEFLWVIQDTYEGQSFFDRWSFFNLADPTHGTVEFVDRQTAFNSGLAYVTDDNIVVMKGDNTTWLPEGGVRPSVRITSNTSYNTGLFILDLNHAPWGCGVWPAFWTVGPNWPQGGEIDILEGVHNNENNQVTWHTGPGCTLTPNASFSGSLAGNLDCDVTSGNNAGCGIIEWSRASYGPYFDAQQGGVFAMKWDDLGISVWSFYRQAIPEDITNGQSPNPSTWIEPVAQLSPSGCDPLKYFYNHSVIFDITFCGDWAGNSYATSDCPGTCAERVMDPSNFVNASWSINSLKVYQKISLTGKISSAERTIALDARVISLIACLLVISFAGL